MHRSWGRVFVTWLAWLVAIIITQIKRPRDLISQSVTSLHLNCCCFLFSNPVFFFCYLCRVCVCIWWTPIRHSLLIQRAIDDLCRPFNESARFNYAQVFHYSHPHPLSTTEQTKIVIYRPLSGLVFTLSSLLLAYSNSKTWAQFFLVSDWRSFDRYQPYRSHHLVLFAGYLFNKYFIFTRIDLCDRILIIIISVVAVIFFTFVIRSLHLWNSMQGTHSFKALYY